MSLLAASLVLASATTASQADDSLLRSYVACLAKRDVPKMERLLAADGEGNFRAAATDLAAEPRCGKRSDMESGMFLTAYSVNPGKLRGIVAEALLRRPGGLARLPALPREKTYTANWFLVSGRPRPMDEMAVCVAATYPDGIARLIQTRPGSAVETDAFAALNSSLGQCLSVGYELRGKPAEVRGALSEAIFHRAYASLAQTGGRR